MQHRLLFTVVELVVEHLDEFEHIDFALRDLGGRHIRYGATETLYPVVRDAMLNALQRVDLELWNPELAEAWTEALDLIMHRMISGARTPPPARTGA